MKVLDIDVFKFNECQLKNFINFLYNECDMILMAIPNFNRIRILDDEMNKDYKQYLNNIDYILKDIEPYTIYKYNTKKYITACCNYVLDVRLVKFYDGFKRILLDSGGFHNWIYPNYPEDLCFFTNKEQCRFFTTAYDNKYYFVNPIDREKKVISELDISYKETLYREFKRLEYYLDRNY